MPSKDGDVSFPTLPDKYAYPSTHRPDAFLDSLRAGGWEPGKVPESVIFTYAHYELHMAAHPELYTPNHMLGTGPWQYFLVNSTDGSVGVNCLGTGAPAAVVQLEVQAELGVQRCISIGTAGGFQPDQQPGDLVVLTSAIRDEGTSHHYLPADTDAVPDHELTARYCAQLQAIDFAFTTGSTVTTDAPFRTTAEEIRLHRSNRVRAVEMEAAALFALGQVRHLPVCSAVVIDAVPDEAGTAFRLDRTAARGVLNQLLSATLRFLIG